MAYGAIFIPRPLERKRYVESHLVRKLQSAAAEGNDFIELHQMAKNPC